LDAFANLEQERRALEEIFNRYQLRQEQARALTEEISRAEEQQALRAFQMQEIERAAIVPGEDSLLVEEKKRLQHAEELQRIISEGYQTLYETEESILSVLSRCAKKIRRGAELDQRLSTIGEALEELEIKLEDVCLALRDAQGVMQPDPYRLDEILERIRVINQLKRKYGPSLEEVMAFKEELVLNHADLQERKDALKCMKKELDDMGSQLVRHAVSLSGKRKKSARALEADVEDELNQLHMPNTRFRLHFSGTDEEEDPNRPPPIRDIRADGLDRVEFLISPNVGEELRPLSKIASGGELSRIMLALKTILAKAGTVETLIFDEVDAGIGGATAEVVGEKLLALSRYHQILCISHLPQIASKGENHFLVKKTTQGGRSQTNIVDLGPEERVREIARLLGGKEITPKAVAHAKEMLGQGQ
jgi:DNA repair protein RecN (Recombination protein N)